MKANQGKPTVRSRVGWTLLVLLWVWAFLVFVVINLFRNVEEFDRVRPTARVYRRDTHGLHLLGVANTTGFEARGGNGLYAVTALGASGADRPAATVTVR